MVKSKTKIEKQTLKKRNPEIVETIRAAKKKEKWIKIAGILSGSRRKMPSLNLTKIDKDSKEGDTVVVPGKVLSQGEINKKIKVVALGFSEKAREKLMKSKSDPTTILKEIKKNPDAKGVNILT
jgi:large subunit ribosomal protein L18e